MTAAVTPLKPLPFEGDMDQAAVFGVFLDWLLAPTPAQLWLERAAAQLQDERDRDDSKRASSARLKVQVMERDGSDCWFCGQPLNGDVTLEHLHPLALGGNWSLGNLALAHRRCNKIAGHMSRIKKEELREQMRIGPIAKRLNEEARDGR